MQSFSREKVINEGLVSRVDMTLRFANIGLYEVVTYCDGDAIYPGLGEVSIESAYVRVINGILHDTSGHFDFDSDVEDSVFTPLTRFPRQETKNKVASFFDIDLDGIALGVDDKLLFSSKFEKGCVWDPFIEEFVPVSSASDEDADYARAQHASGWVNANLYNPSESND